MSRRAGLLSLFASLVPDSTVGVDDAVRVVIAPNPAPRFAGSKGLRDGVVRHFPVYDCMAMLPVRVSDSGSEQYAEGLPSNRSHVEPPVVAMSRQAKRSRS